MTDLADKPVWVRDLFPTSHAKLPPVALIKSDAKVYKLKVR